MDGGPDAAGRVQRELEADAIIRGLDIGAIEVRFDAEEEGASPSGRGIARVSVPVHSAENRQEAAKKDAVLEI